MMDAREVIARAICCGDAACFNESSGCPCGAMSDSTEVRASPAEVASAILAALRDAGPSERMCDAARPLFLYFSCPQSITLGEHMREGGWSTAGLTAEQLRHRGVFPKAERAAMVWNMMLAAAAKQEG